MAELFVEKKGTKGCAASFREVAGIAAERLRIPGLKKPLMVPKKATCPHDYSARGPAKPPRVAAQGPQLSLPIRTCNRGSRAGGMGLLILAVDPDYLLRKARMRSAQRRGRLRNVVPPLRPFFYSERS